MYTGTQEERGLLAWGQSSEDSKDKPLSSDYEEGYEIYEIKSWTDKVKKFTFQNTFHFYRITILIVLTVDVHVERKINLIFDYRVFNCNNKWLNKY